jgi:hypothetical protein
MDGRIGLDLEQFFDAHAAGSGDAAEIVADEIDDHQILRPLLFAVRKTRAPALVLIRIGAAWRGAFHRTRDAVPSSMRKNSSGVKLKSARSPSSM